MSIRDKWIEDQKKAEADLAAHDASMAPTIAQRDALQAEYEAKLRPLNDRIRKANVARSELQWVHGKLTQAIGPNINLTSAA